MGNTPIYISLCRNNSVQKPTVKIIMDTTLEQDTVDALIFMMSDLIELAQEYKGYSVVENAEKDRYAPTERGHTTIASTVQFPDEIAYNIFRREVKELLEMFP